MKRFKPGDICIEITDPKTKVEVVRYLTLLPTSITVKVLEIHGYNYENSHFHTVRSEDDLELESIYNSPLYKALS